jgi:type II secretory pathway pseudopilin PulG
MRRHVKKAAIARSHMRTRPFPRSAMTLAELLVVVMIIVLLLGIGVPMMKLPMMENRLREGSRQLNVFFAQAQARAREIQRPVAVWIERLGTGGNYATELYLAETPPPYAGDFFDAKAVVAPVIVSGNTRWQLNFLNASAASLVGLVADGERFGIKFGYRGQVCDAVRSGNVFELWFSNVLEARNWQPPPGCFLPGPDGFWGADGDDNTNGVINDLGEAGWTGSDDVSVGLPYQIYLSPRRSSDAPLQLPTGIAVDLNCSGIGIEIPPSLPAPTNHISGIEFAGRWDGTQCVPATTPVLIAVGPDGGVQWVRADGVQAPATNTIHLLVGRIDHTVVQDNTPTTPNPIRWSSTNATNFAYDGNMVDPSTIWVSIASRTGSVTTSENGWQFTGNPVNFRDSLLYSREFAQSARPMVGR